MLADATTIHGNHTQIMVTKCGYSCSVCKGQTEPVLWIDKEDDDLLVICKTCVNRLFAEHSQMMETHDMALNDHVHHLQHASSSKLASQ